MNKMESRNTNSAIAMVPNTENEKGIENHKKAAKHLTEAANNHIQAAKYHQSGNHAKAAQHIDMRLTLHFCAPLIMNTSIP